MRGLQKWVWTVVLAIAATPVAAQQTSTGGGTGGGTGGTGGTGGGTGGTGGINSGGTSGGSGLGSGSNALGGSQGGNSGGSGYGSTGTGGTLQAQAAPKLAAPTGTASNSLQKSNFLAGFYANPLYQGQISSQTNAAPGGFGNPLFPTTGGNTTGARGATGIGGRGTQNSANQSGIIIPIPVQMNYTSQLRFAPPPVAAGKMVTELRSAIDNAPALTNSKAVQVITDANNNVTLRGTVKNDDEARLIEGLVRLTPGVGEIRNELAFPVASK